MTKQKLHIFIAKTHKWVALILGLQLLAWTASGVIMTWMPLEEVRGNHNAANITPKPLPERVEVMSIAQLRRQVGQPILTAQYKRIVGMPVVYLELADGSTQIRQAVTGVKISPINKNMARTIAKEDFAPGDKIIKVTKLTEPVIDYRGPLPVWQVKFSDKENTHLYVSVDEARVVARRTDRWRLFDFFWMLHIMDYDERDDINNPLLMSTAFFGLLFVLTGFILVYFRFHRRDFKFLKRRG